MLLIKRNVLFGLSDSSVQMDAFFFSKLPVILDTDDLTFKDYTAGRGFLIDKRIRRSEPDNSAASFFFDTFDGAIFFPQQKALIRCRNGNCIEFIDKISVEQRVPTTHY